MWYNHFNLLLNNSPNIDNNFEETANNFISQHDSRCDTCTVNEPNILNVDIELDEINVLIKDLKNAKQPVIDGIKYQFFKTSGDIMMNHIRMLCNATFTTGIYPHQWCEAIISPLHEKGPKSNITNYRGISLLCTISKIFTNVLNNRLVRWAEQYDKLDDSQGAYRKGRSTLDHIFSLYSIIHKYLRKRGGSFYVAFIDFSRVGWD